MRCHFQNGGPVSSCLWDEKGWQARVWWFHDLQRLAPWHKMCRFTLENKWLDFCSFVTHYVRFVTLMSLVLLKQTFSASVPFMVMALVTKLIISSSSSTNWYLSCSSFSRRSLSSLAPKCRVAVATRASSQRLCSPPASWPPSSRSRRSRSGGF